MPCLLISTLLVLGAISPPSFQDSPAPQIVFVVGEGEYKSERSMPALADLLKREYGFRCTVLIDEALHAGPRNSIEGLEALRDADLAVFYLRFRQLPAEQLAQLQAYVDSGRPVVGFRTTTHAFLYPDEDTRSSWNDGFGIRVMGAPWKYHYGHDSSTQARTNAAGGIVSPILEGVPTEFAVRSWTYHVRPEYPPAGARVLVHGRPRFADGRLGDEDTRNPIVWTRTHSGGGKVFFTTMGHPEDFRSEAFMRLVVNGVHWALGREIPNRPAAALRIPTGVPWIDMDYGSFLSASIEADWPEGNLARKGIALALGDAPRDRAELAVLFDTELMRWAAGWTGGFLEWNGVVFDGVHGTWPHIDGEQVFGAGVRPGWSTGRSLIDPRPRPFGSLPGEQARWLGLHRNGDQLVLHYEVDGVRVWEHPSFARLEDRPVFRRRLRVAAHDRSLRVLVTEAQSSGSFRVRGSLAAAGGGANPAGVSATFAGSSPGQARWALDEASGALTVELAPSEQTLDFEISLLAGSEPAPESFVEAAQRWAGSSRPIEDLLQAGPNPWPGVLLREARLDVREGVEVRVLDEGRVLPSEGAIEYEVQTAPGREWHRLDAHPGCAIFAESEPEPVEATEEGGLEQGLVAHWRFEEGHGDRARSVRGRSKHELEIEQPSWRRGREGRALEFEGRSQARVAGLDDWDMRDQDFSLSVWAQTAHGGTILSMAAPAGSWIPDGKTWFIRDGRLVYDIGWVGDVESEVRVDDERWHHLALTYEADSGEVVLWVDGEEVGADELKPGRRRTGQVFRLGFTAPDFPQPRSWFSGRIDDLRLYERILEPDEIGGLAGRDARRAVDVYLPLEPISAGSRSAVSPIGWRLEDETLLMTVASDSNSATEQAGSAGGSPRLLHAAGDWVDLEDMIMELEAAARVQPAFVTDTLSWPRENPWHSWMRFGGFDFLDGGRSALLTTWSGDVWRVEGLHEVAQGLRWSRFAAGLHQPLGLQVLDGEIFISDRNQVTRLHDRNRDGAADDYEVVDSSVANSEHFHEFVHDLQAGLGEEASADLYLIKGARHGLPALFPHHGSLVRIPRDGSASEIVATGFRAPNGLAIDADGLAWTTDQEGHWMPANKLTRIEPGGFHGNGWSWLPEGVPETFVPPVCWIHPSVDRSPSAPVFVESDRWGLPRGSALMLSYGTGQIFHVLTQTVDGRMQGGLTPLPLRLPTGLLRGRFSPLDGQLYVCGLVGWSTDQTEPGGFHRVRYTGKSWPHLVGLNAFEGSLELEFNQGVDASIARDTRRYRVQSWDYRWTEAYGSPEFNRHGREGRNEHRIEVVRLSSDQRTVRLSIPDLEPAMQVHTSYSLRTEEGAPLDSFVHHTIHALPKRR